MDIVFASRSIKHYDEWLHELRAALPQLTVRDWRAGEHGQARIAVVWDPPAALFEREPQLEIVFNIGAGVDALLNMPGRPASVRLVRLEDGGMAILMAQYALYYLLRVARGFADYERLQARQDWRRLDDFQPGQWPVGIMGAGVIGARVAQAIASLEFPVALWSRSGRAPAGLEAHAGAAGMDAFLARTRVLINVLPLTPQTTGILSRRVFDALLPGAYLINMARGAHLVEEDLLAALADGQLAGAALDVFAAEPLPQGHPFWVHPRIQVTPHLAGISQRSKIIEQIAGKIRAFLHGTPVSGVVDPHLGY
ncbi:2-hydroxyacid dehydrogenase [Castellaniella sp.]|uniref:2-hydroxyacid dehydrogenase n=1 Tax=Castellaniella sp. TaxID=1955812 RepID=UPI00355CA698